MFEDKIEREDLEKMPAEYKELLERVLTIQADCEIGGPHRCERTKKSKQGVCRRSRFEKFASAFS